MNDQDHFLLLADSGHPGKQVWVVGCSFADGMYVDRKKRYGQLVADQLGLPVSFLSLPGTSIEWAADQILRSNIKPDDIVLWGITGVNRYSLYHKGMVKHISQSILDNKHSVPTAINWVLSDTRPIVKEHLTPTIEKYTFDNPLIATMREELVSDNRLHKAITSIFQVQNYCKKIGAKLVMYYHPLSISEFEQTLLQYLNGLDNHIHLSKQVDVSNDNWHPGVITHNNWANEILDFLKK